MASSSLNSASFYSKMSLAVILSSFRRSRLQPENKSSFAMFFRISKPSSLSARCSSSMSSFSSRPYLISIICLMHRCRHELPSMSWAFGSAPSFNSACTFYMSMFTHAKCSAFAPLLSYALTLTSCSLLKTKIERTPS